MRRHTRAGHTWVHEAFVSSDSEPGVEHEIERNEDGALRCQCMSFRFAKGKIGTATKTCRHLQALEYLPHQTVAAPTPPRPNAQVSMTTAKGSRETFRFRRSISFGPLGGGR